MGDMCCNALPEPLPPPYPTPPPPGGSNKPGHLQDVMFTPQKGRSAPNSLEEERAETAKTNTTETLEQAAAMFPPKRVCQTALPLPLPSTSSPALCCFCSQLCP